MNGRVLIVDDDEMVRDVIRSMLEMHHFESCEAGTGAELHRMFKEGQPPDVVLLDLQLPDSDGLELLPEIKRNWSETEVIVLTGRGSFDSAVEATKRGAFHFQSKPFETKALMLLIERAIEHKRLSGQASSLRQAVSTLSGSTPAVFQSPAMKSVLRVIERVAPTDVSVLITGESGTGKEVVCDLIHSMSPRCGGPLIKVNCAALPRDLIESELFGSVKGAFTGATADREGLFRQADHGTLMLDELAEMPIETQSKLLRVLQEKEIRPVGGRVTYKTDCRVIAATNRRPEDAIKEGKLREDLFYRISAISLHLPPLRERKDDILPLANSFLRRYASQAGRLLTGFAPAAEDVFRRFEWPGNVRQLQNEVQRAVLMCEGRTIEVQDLSITSAPEDGQLEQWPNMTLMEGVERNAIIQMLKETGGNKVETAKRLGIGRQTLYNKIKAYGIQS